MGYIELCQRIIIFQDIEYYHIQFLIITDS